MADPLADLACRYPRCDSAACSDVNGFPLPFCGEHYSVLSKPLREALERITSRSVFDPTAVQAARSLVKLCVQHLSARARKAKGKARAS